MISKKISKILEEGRDNKVLVQWIDVTVYGEGKDNDDIEIDVEYSIHTKGDGHTEENHNLIWGSYFDDLKRAKGTFEYYSYDNDIFRDIVKDAKDFANKWYEEQDPFAIDHNPYLEFLSICPNGDIDNVYVFEGDGYRYLENEYKNSCLDSFITFEEYVIYDSQNW